MSPQIETMIQSPYHHSNENGSMSHGGGPSGSSNGNANSQSSYSSSHGQNHAQGGRSTKQSSQQQQNSPPNSHSSQMYMQAPHVMGSGPSYMGHAPHMQHSPYSMQQQQQGQNMSSPHHPQQVMPHHGYSVPPHNMYHPGPYSQHPYHPQMHPGHPSHHGSYPPQHPYAMQHDRSGNSGTPPKMGDAEYGEGENGYSNKSHIATAVSKKMNKDSFAASVNDSDPVLNVEPMRSDFYFFLQETKENIIYEAKEEVMKFCDGPLEGLEGDLEKLDVKSDEPHPYLLFSNMNEKAIAMWEELPQQKRSEYLVKEEEDRKRFMNAEEVASRHCATLTARARSPQPFTPKNRDKGKHIDEENRDNNKKNDRNKEKMNFSPSATLSMNSMLQSEGEKSDMEEKSKLLKTRLSSEITAGNDDITFDESPTKKTKPEPLVQAKKIYGDFTFIPEKHQNLSKEELLDLAEKIPKEAAEESTNAEYDKALFKTEREKFLNAAHNVKGINGALDSDKKEPPSDELSDNFDDHEEAMEVEKLLDRRIRQVRGRRMKEYLVRWKGFGEESDSWEPFKNVEHCDDMVKEIDEKKKIEKENALKNQ